MTCPNPAAFLAVGSELLRADRLDTNSLLVARLLRSCGFSLVEKRCVEDDEHAIATSIVELAGRTALLIVSGGLGPTADDVTREGVARALGVSLLRHAALEKALLERYQTTGRTMPAIALRMADIVEGAEILPNPQGTAPGQLLAAGGCTIVLLPGVPRELEEIFTANLLHRWECQQRVTVRTLHLGGVFESAVEQVVSPLYERFGRENVSILAGRGLVDLVLSASGDGAEGRVEEMDAAFAAAVGRDLFGRDDDTIVSRVLDEARRHGWRIAAAESCTSGMVGAQLTSVAGASEVFVGGVMAYSNELKERLLGVPAALLGDHGAVSREAAEAMAAGALTLGAECSIAVTGIAGPSGGSDEKPVGTVFMTALTPGRVASRHFRFPGKRTLVREFAANFALDLLRRTLEESR